jgi:ABC-2 type transport system ATP-binding protein
MSPAPSWAGPSSSFSTSPPPVFDPEARRQFWALIRQLSADGTTILLTTHYLDEAAALATRIAIIDRGRLVAQGTPGELRNNSGARKAAVSWEGADSQRHTKETSTPTRLITDLAKEFHGEIPGLTVTSPTLEDIYLELIAAEGAPQ